MTAPRPKTRLEMPFLLLCGMGFSALFTGIGTVVMVFMIPMVVFGNGPFTSNGVQVDKATFLSDAAPVLLGMPMLLGAYGAIAYGLWKERPWTRTAIMVFWGAFAAAMIPMALLAPSDDQDLVGSLVSFAIFWGIAAWYCYGKGNVVAYFQAIEEQDARQRAILAGALREPVAPPPEVS